MRLFVLILAIVLLLAPALLRSETPPQFKDYPAEEAFQGPNAPLKLSRDARMFRTRLRDAAKQKPNFAGHYIVTFWGCGSDCRDAWIVDAKTGAPTSLPFSIVSFPGDDFHGEPLEYRLNSKLLIIRGHRNEEETGGTYYYKWENEKLVPIGL